MALARPRDEELPAAERAEAAGMRGGWYAQHRRCEFGLVYLSDLEEVPPLFLKARILTP